MRRVFPILWLSLAVGLPAVAEEISLKDGTKIVGHMTALSPDKVEVETAYDKMQLKRNDIVTINFPENKAPTPARSRRRQRRIPRRSWQRVQAGRSVPGRDQAKLRSTLPQEWVINPDIRRAPETLTVLSPRDKMRFLLVMQEEYPGLGTAAGRNHAHGARKFFDL